MLHLANPGWQALWAKESAQAYFARLSAFVEAAYKEETVYPPRELVFAALEQLAPTEVKLVILGQDPYHEPGEAQGLAFYVPPGIKVPPSLVNIAKELQAEATGADAAKLKRSEVRIPDLREWARQGVLLLNATLTVAAGQPLSHRGRGWEQFTDAVIRYLDATREHLVFVLWGAQAQRKGAFIDRQRHCVIECAHPSPLSARRGFFGSNCFRIGNDYLRTHGITPIAF